MRSPTIPVLMLTYNCLALTRDAVESVRKQDISTQLLIMDDGSTDGTFEYLRTVDRLGLCGYRHKGVSYLWNQVLSYLFSEQAGSYPAVLVINNDIRLRPDAARLLLADGGQFVTCVGTSSGAQFPGGEPTLSRRPHPDFSCFLIRRECWERVGQFDESMRIYCSDGDYHLRMHQAGIEAYCLDVPFWHEASGTLKHSSEEDQKRILARAGEDRVAFERKWGCAMGSKEYYKLFETEAVYEMGK